MGKLAIEDLATGVFAVNLSVIMAVELDVSAFELDAFFTVNLLVHLEQTSREAFARNVSKFPHFQKRWEND